MATGWMHNRVRMIAASFLIKDLLTQWIFQPWKAGPEVLNQAGVRLGKDYPNRIVRHAIARDVALEAYRKLKR